MDGRARRGRVEVVAGGGREEAGGEAARLDETAHFGRAFARSADSVGCLLERASVARVPLSRQVPAARRAQESFKITLGV